MSVASDGAATTTSFALDGGSVVREMREISGTLTPTVTYLTGPQGPMYRRDDLSGSLRWYVFDGLGSVVAEVDASGSVTCNRGYDVYGATRGSTGTPTSKHGFVGQLGHPTDDDTGLTYMRARYYDPAAGRFVNEDPAQSGANWYSYCESNPVLRVDSTGKFSLPSFAAELIGVLLVGTLVALAAPGVALIAPAVAVACAVAVIIMMVIVAWNEIEEIPDQTMNGPVGTYVNTVQGLEDDR